MMTEQHPKVVKKEVGRLKKMPNLKDYNAARKGFSYDAHKDEIEFFVDGKMNAAYVAVDRHLKTPLKKKVALHLIEENQTKNP
ncbi:hypothetical protein KY359_05720, partial [Candidatus Woesearchaeota archaeon]|nr:hypothetical protein [Candidatus Woesearchaeota archaeon]